MGSMSLTVLDGSTFCVCDERGDVDGIATASGFFASDTRFLSRSVLTLGGARPELLSYDQPAPHLAGFRPEHVQVGNGRPDSVHYEGTVEVVEYLGDEQLAHVRLGDHDIVVKLPVEPRLQAGRRETFSVPLQKVLLFDEESTHTVGTAA